MSLWWLLPVALVFAAIYYLLRRKKATHWVGPAAAGGLRNWFIRRPTPVHVLFALTDHFEPARGGVPDAVADERLDAWLERFPPLADQHLDSDGRPVQHTWFYPWDEWREGDLARIGQLCFDGYGEIELHLHHEDDDSDSMRRLLTDAVASFNRYGAMLSSGSQPAPNYGFIHGNWCLDNSRPDGRWCGVNDEMRILAATGCYADFTLPTPDRTQPRMVNVIYRATEVPSEPRSHDRGRPVSVGEKVPGDLLLIPGPLGINFRDWSHRWYPAIEMAEIAHHNPLTPARVDFWVRAGIGVRGRPDWIFVKCHAHGCVDRDREDMLGEARHKLHRMLERRYRDGSRHALHYCTARELYNLVIAAEDGLSGDPNDHRDHALPPPVNRLFHSAGPAEVTALSESHGAVRALTDTVDWRFRVGPLRELSGAVTAVEWRGKEVRVEAAGEYRRVDR